MMNWFYGMVDQRKYFKVCYQLGPLLKGLVEFLVEFVYH